MERKWSILEKKETWEKCCHMETAIRTIFESPSSWVNGFIRLVSLEGTWYQHRATDIFIPMEQKYLENGYRAEKRPERSPISINAGRIVWDYLKEEEALQIIPYLPVSNMPKTFGAAGLGERCRHKKIFLKNGMVYDEEQKRVRYLQKNEEGTILQIYRVEEKYKRKDMESWNYDIYLWAKIGLTPSALYTSKESWNTMQFLINNFHNIDFEDFLLPKESEKTNFTEKKEDKEKIEPIVSTKPETSVRYEETLGTPKLSTESEYKTSFISEKSASSLETKASFEMEDLATKTETESATLKEPEILETLGDLEKEEKKETVEISENTQIENSKILEKTEVEENLENPRVLEEAKVKENPENSKILEEVEVEENLENSKILEEMEVEENPENSKILEEVEVEENLENPKVLEKVEVEENLENPKVLEEVEVEENPENAKVLEKAESEEILKEPEIEKIAEVLKEPEVAETLEKVEKEKETVLEREENCLNREKEIVKTQESLEREENLEGLKEVASVEPFKVLEKVEVKMEVERDSKTLEETKPLEESKILETSTEPEYREKTESLEKTNEIEEKEVLQSEISEPVELSKKSEKLKEVEISGKTVNDIIKMETPKEAEPFQQPEIPEKTTDDVIKMETPREVEPSKQPEILGKTMSDITKMEAPKEAEPSKQPEIPEKTVDDVIKMEIPKEVKPSQSEILGKTVSDMIKIETPKEAEPSKQPEISGKTISDMIKMETPKKAEPSKQPEISGKIVSDVIRIEIPKEAKPSQSEISGKTVSDMIKIEPQKETKSPRQLEIPEKIEMESFVKPEITKEPENKEISKVFIKPKELESAETFVKLDFHSKPTETLVKLENFKNQNHSEVQNSIEKQEDPTIQSNHTPVEELKQSEKIEGMETVEGQKGEEEVDENMEKIQTLLDCDKNRCRLEPYDKDILFDIIRGHWELFEAKGGLDTKEAVERQIFQEDSDLGYENLIARDPKLDIREGVVGIDFGTKSTVVVRQDATNRIVPIRIGTGNLSDEVKEEDFENPTIIEFTNVKKFLEDYQSEVGRPHTSCNDIFVSYDAYEDFRNCKPDDFYAYFSELKQWANQEKGKVLIKDKQKEEYYLGEHMEITEGIVNPIELYAYYIGLYINNMRNGIYLNYLMTFPVGYAKEVRDFIADSFCEGIKKSLPTSILNDPECMEQFKVKLGISEPAAYAVTALEQSHLEPKDETEQFMYGIFDFGGGTTDFDFGICRGATDEEYEREAYDYVLECFGADSDVTLGGENILELLAYQVYQKNLEVFREKKITFTLPAGENSFAGSETLLINSQIARRNMSILKEELRPLWHQEQGWRKKYQLDNESSQNEVDKEGIIVSLYNMNGEPVPQCILEFSSQDLVELIKKRIQKGIDSFFQCLIKMFLCKEKVKKEENKIYIFLAGNSSKSIFVKELFQKKIEEYYSRSKRMTEDMGNAYFELIDPLTGENTSKEHYVPNAKTGVAYGLLKSRPGSSIKIEKNYETDALQQSRFHYYLGRDHRHYFDCKFSPAEIEYKKWVPFQGATREVVRIYYTNNPIADSKIEQMPIENVPYKEIHIDVKEDALLFIRTVEPDMIEYVVAQGLEEISTSEIKKCYF